MSPLFLLRHSSVLLIKKCIFYRFSEGPCLQLFFFQLASWEEGIAQARTACEAWRREADDANRKFKLSEQTKEEVRLDFIVL